MAKENRINWSDVKSSLSKLPAEDLTKLVSELYDLSSQNKDFLDARFLCGNDVLERYKKQIKEYIAPKEPWKKDTQVSKAKKVLSQYKKATGDEFGLLDLMISYAEYGTNFTSEYGLSYDGSEPYLCSVSLVFEDAVKMACKLSLEKSHPLFGRLITISKKMVDAYILDEDEIAEIFGERKWQTMQ